MCEQYTFIYIYSCSYVYKMHNYLCLYNVYMYICISIYIFALRIYNGGLGLISLRLTFLLIAP